MSIFEDTAVLEAVRTLKIPDPTSVADIPIVKGKSTQAGARQTDSNEEVISQCL